MNDADKALALVREYARLTAMCRPPKPECTARERYPDDLQRNRFGPTCWERFCNAAGGWMRDSLDQFSGSSDSFDTLLDGRDEGDLCPACERYAAETRPAMKAAKIERGNVRRRIVALGRKA